MAVALVTGASRGIGRATALALADAGCGVGLLARSREALEETRVLVAGRGVGAASTAADVTDPEAVECAVAEVERKLGPVDALVNNAGSLRAIGPLWEVEAGDWWADVHTSLGGAFATCRAVVPGMVERRAGRIVNVVSYSAARPAPYESGYAAGKAALASLTEALATSLAEYGVQAFSVAPGFTSSEMTRHLVESEAGRRWLPEAGTGRVVAAVQSAELIAALALGAADELTGRFLHTLDDLETLLARLDEIRRDDLYALRLRRLPGL
jgi:NAD(P)-dependent dehydrogenase (short-subunit alcohol dehydrogenase family)